MHLFPNPKTVYGGYDKLQDFLSKKSLSYQTFEGDGVAKPVTHINDAIIVGWDEAKLMSAALKAITGARAEAGGDQRADVDPAGVHPARLRDDGLRSDRRVPRRLFPARIRYTSMSLPYHIGNRWFRMLPLTATALVATKGDIFAGLWRTVIVAAITALRSASSSSARTATTGSTRS